MKRKTKNYFLIAVVMSTNIIVSGQTKPVNPFGLVYQDAITKSVSGEVNIHTVTYKLNGIDI
ncbi:MAG TPA: alpha/beta hydrolase, partial [Bacteroidales bacterium]|nr:alpha/beta hydrolase [Bacteroidales bacterium]